MVIDRILSFIMKFGFLMEEEEEECFKFKKFLCSGILSALFWKCFYVLYTEILTMELCCLICIL